MTSDEKIDLLLQEVINFKQELNNFKQESNNFKQELNDFKQEVNDFIQEMRQKVNSLEQTVEHNTVVTENIIDKCIQAMGEGIQLNAERFDRLDIDSVRLKAEQALLIAQMVNEKINKMTA
ncbi:MAG: hypothetical protein J1F01_01350 [Oscillospiraceae bacterium]|nr:hypothetical protein [Oscillospiraceae bacterium]